jgi:hypothetical protein
MLRLFVFSCPGSYDGSVTLKTWKSIGESNSSSQDENLMS